MSDQSLALPEDKMAEMMRIAVERGPDGVEALRALMDMREAQEDRAAKRAFAAAFTRVQAEIEPVIRDRENTHTRSRYATHTAVLRSIRPIYTRHGFSVIHTEVTGEGVPDGCVRVQATVMHADGHERVSVADVPIDAAGSQGKRNKTDTQAKGSTLTYAMRYVDMLIWCPELVDEDTDGARARNDIERGEETITAEQAATLDSLISEVAANREAFLQWVGVQQLSDVPASWYRPAVARLERKREQS